MSVIHFFQFIGTLFWILSILGAVIPVFLPSLGLADTSKYGKSLVDPRTGNLLRDNGDSENIHRSRFHQLLFSFLQRYSVPKKWFTHYYVLAFISNAIVLFLTHSHGYPLWSILLVLFYTAHCLRRLYECYFVHVWSNSRMSFPLYVVGLLHYVFAPFSLLPICKSERAIISIVEIIMVQFPALVNVTKVLTILRSSSVLIVSLLFFLAGNVIQYRSHKALANVRQRPSIQNVNSSSGNEGNMPVSRMEPNSGNVYRRVPHEEGSVNFSGVAPSADSGDFEVKGKVQYSFPRGCRYFKYTLSPHYTAELAIYAALVSAFTISDNLFNVPEHFPVCSGSGMTVLSTNIYLMLLWVGVNLTITAFRTKEWYVTRYPNDSTIGGTSAIIPAFL